MLLEKLVDGFWALFERIELPFWPLGAGLGLLLLAHGGRLFLRWLGVIA